MLIIKKLRRSDSSQAGMEHVVRNACRRILPINQSAEGTTEKTLLSSLRDFVFLRRHRGDVSTGNRIPKVCCPLSVDLKKFKGLSLTALVQGIFFSNSLSSSNKNFFVFSNVIRTVVFLSSWSKSFLSASLAPCKV